LAKTGRFDPLIATIGPAVWPGHCRVRRTGRPTKNKGENQSGDNWVSVRLAPLTYFGMWGGPPDRRTCFLFKFELKTIGPQISELWGGGKSPLFPFTRHIA